ncbi:hypothetical protein I2I05_00360 [Hymenobacter sp. BT683]|uniref:Glycosyltransferase RgtA/B/C/D-like domain-containing protein n=1 Tax=Hymenobacter jeongseonensis TaxID=2791027 RepID=A0ABS0IBV3_9BACT|nr:hypothetical protein [Hymenobacter jeongseonensis]MBF9235836.1 hypothetical protein [Hymenobacter jeongseonensis]
MLKLSRPYHVAAAVLLAIAAACLFGPYLWMLPEGTHVWPQTDRLSLAVNFYDFEFDFWHPRTSSLESIGGITGVEFPIQPYLAALGGLIFGRDNIVAVFRGLDVAMAVLGFWYLFRIVFERTGNFAAGLLPGAFLLTAPTYAFYAGSTLPDPFSLSLTFAGYYYWLRYFDTSNRFADLLWALAVLILAALIKTTCALHLGAVAGITLLYAFLEPNRFTHWQRLQFLGTLGVGLALLIGFYLHNTHLNEEYQSQQFLAVPKPAEGVETWHEYLRVVKETWWFEYLTRTQYRILLVCSVVCVALVYRSWRLHLRLLMLLLATLAIAFLFYQLMGAQLAVHDYYVICSFLPPVVLAVVMALVLVAPLVRRPWLRYAFSGGLLVLSGYLVHSSFGQLAGRMSDDHPPVSIGYTHRWMRGGADLLAKAGVPQKALVLVLEDYSPNMALVFFDRRGRNMATYLPDTKLGAIVEYMSAFGLEYVIMKQKAYQRLQPERAALLENFAPVVEQQVVVLRRLHPEQRAW